MVKIYQGLLLMISAQRRKQIGQLIRNKRKYLNLDQIGLANRVWEQKQSAGALQSRISRIERGESWSDYKLVFEVIDALDLWDDVLESKPADSVKDSPADYSPTFDQMLPSFEKHIPNLREALKILYSYSVHNQLELFYRQLAIFCDTAQRFYADQQQNL